MAKVAKYHKRDCTGGSCTCPYRLDFRPQGVRGPRKRLEFPTKKAAEKYLAATSTKVSRNEYIEPAKVPTFKDVAEDWLRSKGDRRPSYVADLRSRLDLYLLPRFGLLRLDQISVGAIETMRDDLRQGGRATRTVNGILQMGGAVYKMAIRRGLYNANPLDRVERAYAAARELSTNGDEKGSEPDTPDAVLAPTEIARMLATVEPGLYRTLLTTLAFTGMRSGEAFALRWGDCELDGASPKIFVRRSLSWARLKGEPMRPKFYPPKTKKGLRDIRIALELAAILKRWKIQSPPSEYDLVFTTTDGQPIHRSVALRRGLWPALRRAGLRTVNMHSLRHTFASALIAKGAPVTEVQSILGHSSPAVTLNVYSHWFHATHTSAMDAVVREILSGSSEKSGQKVGIDRRTIEELSTLTLASNAS